CLCRLRPRRSGTDRHRDYDQLRGHGGDFDDCGAGVGKAHGAVKPEKCTDCRVGGTLGGAGVTTDSVYPTNSREKLRQQHGRCGQIKLTGKNRRYRTFASAVVPSGTASATCSLRKLNSILVPTGS